MIPVPGSDRRLRLRILLWHARRPALVLGGVTAAVVLLRLLTAGPEPTEVVVVAARHVAAGTTLTGADLRVRHVPGGLVPEGAVRRLDEVEGRTALHPLARGLPLTPAVVGGDRFDVVPPPGHVVAAVRLDSGPSTLLRAGDIVELLAARQGGDAQGRASADVVSSRALVLAVREEEAGAGLLSGGTTDPPTTLLALTPADGRRLAAVREGASLTALLVP